MCPSAAPQIDLESFENHAFQFQIPDGFPIPLALLSVFAEEADGVGSPTLEWHAFLQHLSV